MGSGTPGDKEMPRETEAQSSKGTCAETRVPWSDLIYRPLITIAWSQQGLTPPRSSCGPRVGQPSASGGLESLVAAGGRKAGRPCVPAHTRVHPPWCVHTVQTHTGMPAHIQMCTDPYVHAHPQQHVYPHTCTRTATAGPPTAGSREAQGAMLGAARLPAPSLPSRDEAPGMSRERWGRCPRR